MDTGKFDKVQRGYEATEIIHIRQHSPDAYGVPRWINQLPSVLGSRESEECNLRYFEDNTVPPMILSVSGGRLTKQSYQEMKGVLEAQGVGKERQHKIMLIEAVPEREGLDDKGSVSVRIDKLTDSRQSDGLFKEYDEGNQAKIRSSFRLPPVAIGMSQDTTFATARVSAFVAESQVYRPARDALDEVLNKRIIQGEAGLGLQTVRLASRVPSITDPESLIKSLTALNVMGALTPRTANETANRILQIELPEYPKEGEESYEEWMDKPILFVTRGIKSQDGQESKDTSTKGVEKDGDVGLQQPEHGDE
jgi:capsid portal protein